jgi:hypothetical protein
MNSCMVLETTRTRVDRSALLDLLVEGLAQGDAEATNLLCQRMSVDTLNLAEDLTNSSGSPELKEGLGQLAARRLWFRLTCREYHPLPWSKMSMRPSYQALWDYQAAIVKGTFLKMRDLLRI